MRAAMLALLLAASAPLAAAQEAFSDADFGFNIKLPAGLKPADEAARAALLGNADAAKNTPRAEAGGAVQHHYFWTDDTSPYNRQVSIFLIDGVPPWKPDDFPAEIGKTGLTVETHEAMKPPVAGFRVEGTFLREPDKAPMRKTVLYLPDPLGKHYGLVTLQANASDWNIVKDEILTALSSVRMSRTAPPKEAADGAHKGAKPEGAAGKPEGAAKAGGKAPGQGKGGGKGAGKAAAAPEAAASAAPKPEPESHWGDVRVWGSFVLAAAVLAHLVLSGRAPR
jgi:hypothetical protein